METVKKNLTYDVVVVGGGISGVCAALASARHGAKTVIINNRPVFGGNASSEVRMHICGACVGGAYENARETGIIEELQLDNRKVNPQDSFSVFDVVLWEKVKYQPNLDFFLNTHMYEVITENNTIKCVKCTVLASETELLINGSYFIDATGDGTLGAYSNAEFMQGREAKKTFNEQYAPDEADETTMGNTIMFLAKDMGKPIPFYKPFWAYELDEDDLKYRNHDMIKGGYWWIEYGGEKLSTITDNEEIRDELLKWAYGVWDHIKNRGDHGASTLALDWVCVVPGKRESRRLTGDYVLTERDVLDYTVFDDAIAYGGWPMDMHIPGGIASKDFEPTLYINLEKQYSIPYRTIYSVNINNLFLAGRASSNSRMAFGSTRVMATCGLIGQAAGTAAALANECSISPREVNENIKELQRRLAKDDCYIMGYSYLDENDLAKKAKIICSSHQETQDNLKNGLTRNIGSRVNCWESATSRNESIQLIFSSVEKIREVLIRFESNLSMEFRLTMSYNATYKQYPGLPREITKEYQIVFEKDNQVVKTIEVRDNHQRFVSHQFDEINVDKITIKLLRTHGADSFKVYDVNVF
ncbi:MAG: FAD-dependent oxidoreductase [Clostridia bacterium]|nr:FAD-dependent oxidoreductase [Clostridia bacterium]